VTTVTEKIEYESGANRAWDGPPAVDDTDEQKAEYTLARYAVQNDHYRGLYQQWVKPIYFLVGKQWIKWNEQQYSYSMDTDVPPWRQQPVTNWTYAVYRTLMAKMTKQRPTLEVVPPSGDSEDREAAKLGEAILEFLWRYLKHPQKVQRAIGWLLATGNVAFCVDWDDDAGESRPRTCLVEVADPSGALETNGQPSTLDVECACDENGEPLRKQDAQEGEAALDGGLPYDLDTEPDNEAIGEITLDVDDPLSYRWNPEATSAEDAEEMFVAAMWPSDRVKTTFDVDPNELESGSGESGDTREAVQTMLSSVTAASPDPFNSKGNNVGSSNQDQDSDTILVIKYYRKPCANEGYPKGRHWITAGGSKVWPPKDDKEYPNGEAELPFGFWPPRVAVIDTPIPGQPQGLGVLSQVVPLNEKYNYLDGKIGEYHTTSAMGGVIWVHPEDKGIKITSEPGQVKPSKGLALGHPPIRESLPALPGPVYEERNLIAANLNSIAGVSQLDLGQRPEGVSAGRAFLVMQEASDGVIMPTLMALEAAVEEVGRRELVIAQQKYTEPRVIKIRGDKGQWEFRSFKNTDLRDGLDVRVQTGSTFPWSKSAQWDVKLNLLSTLKELVMKKDGSIDQEKVAKYLEAGASGLSAFESDEDADLVEIDREHAMFEEFDPTDPSKSNQLPQLAVWQNQPKHQEYHFEFMKRSFARFSRWSDPAKAAFMQHLQLTTQAVDALAQMAAGIPQGGGGPEAPDGGGAPPGEPGAPPSVPAGPPPAAGGPLSTARLTRGDRSAAGQAA
jgi:hypothetical protein